MAMKDFDFKGFMLKRGEWVGLGVAVVIVIPLILTGVSKAVQFMGGPSANTHRLKNESDAALSRINLSRPDPGTEDTPQEIVTLIDHVSNDRVNVNSYLNETPFFFVTALEDSKRRMPSVLLPGELRADFLPAAMRGIILIKVNDKLWRVQVLKEKGIVHAQMKDKKSKQARIIRYNTKLAGGAGGGRGAGEGMVGPGGEGGGMDTGPAPGAGQVGPGAGMVTRIELKDLGNVKDDDRLAERTYPLEMVVVQGIFPLKKQLEEFRRALRKRTLTELMAMFSSGEALWEFLPPEIERRELKPDGSEKTPWQPYGKKMGERLQYYLALVHFTEEDEDEKTLKDLGLIYPGLVMPRLPLAPEGRAKYPELSIEGIKATKDALTKPGPDENKKQPTNFEKIVRRKSVNPWDPWNAFTDDQEETKKDQPSAPGESDKKPKDGNPNDPDADLVIPDNVLVRFIDTGVEPGATYEYRIKIKMKNPNFKQKNVAYQSLAEKESIEAAEWTVIPKITIPNQPLWYIAEDKASRDALQVQVHQWVKELADSGPPVGDWTILEKAPAYRGEYIGRVAGVEVPIWRSDVESYEIATNPQTRKRDRVPVDFTVRAGTATEPALLVDFQGGKGTDFRFEIRNADGKVQPRNVKEDSPVQALVLTPDGRLIVKSSTDDLASENEREKRFKEWKEWIEAVKNRKASNRPDDLFNKGGGGKGGGGS
jgi:hypothetical protein